MSVTVKELIRHLVDTCDLDLEVEICGKEIDLSDIKHTVRRKVDLGAYVKEEIRDEVEDEVSEDYPEECPTCGDDIR